ncbi:MAG TPA: hypothetical protein VNS32_19450 [Flavisolibacter sp.]|nr:hypothetical protein [Flavisolibacter sp.]
MRLFNIFKKKKVDSTGSGSTLFYHEDDFCQLELSLIENLPLFQAESEKINDLTAKDSGKHGFTEIYVRNDNRIKLSQRRIKPSELEELLLASGLEKFPAVTTGYGQSYRVVRKRTIGFGSDYFAFFFDYNYGVVQHIWLTGFLGSDEEKLIELMHQIGLKWNLILMDWNQTTVIDLRSRDNIRNYLID